MVESTNSAAAAAFVATPFLTLNSGVRENERTRLSAPENGSSESVRNGLLNRESVFLNLASRDTAQGGALAQAVESTLSAIADRVSALSALAEEAADSSLGIDARRELQSSANVLSQEITALAENTTFADRALLSETQTLYFDSRNFFLLDSDQVAAFNENEIDYFSAENEPLLIPISLIDSSATGLGLDGLDLSSTSGAASASEALAAASETINASRANIGGTVAGFQTLSTRIQEQRESLEERLAARADALQTAEAAQAAAQSVLAQEQAAARAQASSAAVQLLGLLQ